MISVTIRRPWLTRMIWISPKVPKSKTSQRNLTKQPLVRWDHFPVTGCTRTIRACPTSHPTIRPPTILENHRGWAIRRSDQTPPWTIKARSRLWILLTNQIRCHNNHNHNRHLHNKARASLRIHSNSSSNYHLRLGTGQVSRATRMVHLRDHHQTIPEPVK